MAKPPAGSTVDPLHALAPAHCFFMTEGAGRPSDSGISGLPAGTADTPTWITESGETVSSWPGTAHCEYGTGPLLAGKSKFTIVVSVKPATIAQTGGWLTKRTAYQDKAALFVGMVTGTGFGDVTIFQIGNEIDSTLTYGWNPWVGVPSSQVQLIFSYDGSRAAGQRCILYKNGVLSATGINGGSPVLGDLAGKAVPDTLAPIWIGQGGGFGVGNGEYNGTYSYLYAIEDFAADATQAASLFANPFPFAITSPLLTAITASPVADTTATITWTTEVPATSRVEYGIGNFDSSVESATLVTSHSVPLTGLAPASTYQFRVLSTASSVTATSGTYSFGTVSTPAVVSPLLIDRVSTTKMRVSFTTDVETTATLDYGLTAAYGSQSTDAVLSTLHRFSLTGLTASTPYHFRATAHTAAPVSDTITPDQVFSTRAADAVGPVAITDLEADIRVAQNGARLRFTAPDDAIAGRAASYTFKRSAPAAGGVVASENYRATFLFSIDTPPSVFISGAGWANESGNVDQNPSLDSPDHRLTGVVYRANDGTQATRAITLSTTGPHIIRLALGDINAQGRQYFRVLDTAAPVLTVDKPGGSTALHWFDAGGTLKDEATWRSTYGASGVTVSFATTSCVLALGSPTAGADSSTIAHFSIEAVSSGGSPILEADWASAVTIAQSIVPQMAGGIEELEVTGLLPSTEYFFAVKSTDAEGNLSTISNSPSVTTLRGRAALSRWGGDTRIQSPTGKNVGCTFEGISTGLTADTLTDTTKTYPTDGRLVGKLVCPNIAFVADSRMLWFVITSNTEHSVTVATAADGAMTLHASAGNSYIITGVFTTELIGDQWWFIDPDGYAHFPRGTALTVDKYSAGFYNAHPHHAVYLKRAVGTMTANLAKKGATRALNPATATGDVINGTGVTVHLVGDEIIIGDNRPFATTYFQQSQQGVGGVIQWSRSAAGSTWTLLNGTGNPRRVQLLTPFSGSVSANAGDKSFNIASGSYPFWVAGDTIGVSGFSGAAAFNSREWTIVSRAAQKIIVLESGVVTAAATSVTMSCNGNNVPFSLDRSDVGNGPQSGGGYDNGIRLGWFQTADYPAPSAWAPLVYPGTDGEARYYLRGVVTTQFTVDPKVSACFEHSIGRDLLELKYHGSSTTVAQDFQDRYFEIGMNATGYAASYADYAADAFMPRHLPLVGGTGVTYYAHRDVNGVYGPLTPKSIYEAVPNSGSSDINYTYFTSTAISAAAADNSLNLASGTFPDWAPGFGIVLRGFETAGNNKTRVVVSRTATKIVVSGGALVDAAAGPEITLSLIFGGGRHQVDPWDIYLPAGAAAVCVSGNAMRPNPNTLYNTPDEPDFVFGLSGWRGRTHIGYCLIASNPSRLYSQHGTEVSDYRFFGKYAMRDYLRYHYRAPGEVLTPLTRSSQTPIYTYTTGVPTGDELTALNNLNAAWGTAYTTWDTQSGTVETFTNQWGTGTGWLDEDGRNILQPGLYPPDATGGANSVVSYLDLESNLLMPAIWTDVEDFVALTADRYAFVVYDTIRARTPNMITNFLYETWPTMARVLIAQVDLQWIATGYAQVRPTSGGTVPPTAPEPDHTLAQYAIHHKPMWFEVYTTCNADSPENFGGAVTAVSYNAGTNLTAITWALGQPLMIHPHVERFVHLVEVDEWAKIFDWNDLTLYCRHVFGTGDITAMAPVGSHIEFNDAQAFTLGVPISPSTREEYLEADRDEIIVPVLSARMPDGVYPTIGFEKWAESDNPQEYAIENASWSIRTSKFNLYNGTDAVIPASRDANGVWIGGEDKNYGDYITGMKAMWFAAEDALALRTTDPLAPTFVSAGAASWSQDVLSAFLVVTAAAPHAAITLDAGSLPAGVVLLDNSDGSAILGGASAVPGTYPVTLRAANSFGETTQSFTLTIGGFTGTPPVSAVVTRIGGRHLVWR